MRKYRSNRPYPVTLLKGNEQVILYPGQEILLPRAFGDAHPGLLIPCYDHLEHLKQEVVEEKKEEIVEKKIEEKKEEFKLEPEVSIVTGKQIGRAHV